MKGLVLSLFPGIGLLDMAFEEAGFCVVRGPDLIWGGDVRRFNPPRGCFDGVIGGPPCQSFSAMRHMYQGARRTHGNLIPEYERIVASAEPDWFLMENVIKAPVPVVDGYQVSARLVKDFEVGGITFRKRRFSFGSRKARRFEITSAALWSQSPERSALASGGTREERKVLPSGRVVEITDGWKTERDVANHIRLQGLPSDFLAEAPFTVAGKIRAIGNGVPLAMGRAVAAAVVAAISDVRAAP